MNYSLSEKFLRIRQYAEVPTLRGIERDLLHAYVACLTFDELCEIICITLKAEAPLRMALRSRLLRLLRLSDGEFAEGLSLLVQKVQLLHDDNYVLRTRVDALLSAVYSWLPLPTRHMVLERWIDRGTSGTAGRWLKAMALDEPLFDIELIFQYWKKSLDKRAAKIISYRADPIFLNEILYDLINGCVDGWIVSKAVMRATSISDDIWRLIRVSHPASYAYLCAMRGKKLTDDEAISLVEETKSNCQFDGLGLVIWSIGQMGLISVLDRLSVNRETYAAQEAATS